MLNTFKPTNGHMYSHSTTFELGGRRVAIRTGGIACQASGAVTVSIGDAVLLATVVAGRPFTIPVTSLPLTVHYQERLYAGGRIPGSRLRREGPPRERETLVSLLVERAIRPVLPEAYDRPLQVVVTLFSSDPSVAIDVAAILAASAAIEVAGLSTSGPVAAVRIAGHPNSGFKPMPEGGAAARDGLDLVAAATSHGPVMVKSSSAQSDETDVVHALMVAERAVQPALDALASLGSAISAAKDRLALEARHAHRAERLWRLIGRQLHEAVAMDDETAREADLQALRKTGHALLHSGEPTIHEDDANAAFDLLLRIAQRNHLTWCSTRQDRCGARRIRPVSANAGLLPCVHGSALFTSGYTQAIASVTLGRPNERRFVEGVHCNDLERFFLHCNLPPFSVGDIGFMGSPQAREIGHGHLVRRALEPVLPSEEAFPYTLRLVAEITEADGSCSMATICAGTLALLDAGVPITDPVAGISMGLIDDPDFPSVLIDTRSMENRLSDADLQVAGTRRGFTMLEMNAEGPGVSMTLIEEALREVRQGLDELLDRMGEVLAGPRLDLPTQAPRVETLRVAEDKLPLLIGKGGATVRELADRTGATIDIGDRGRVTVIAPEGRAAAEARRLIELITQDLTPGGSFEGEVVKVLDFGVIVRIAPGREGLVHTSQIPEERVAETGATFSPGKRVQVRVLQVDRRGRLRLTMKPKAVQGGGKN